MANTYTLLETITVGAAGASSVTFNSIPQTGYTDLIVKSSIRTTNADPANAQIRFNGSTTGYSERLLYGIGSGTPTSASASVSSIQWGTVGNGTLSTANTFSNCEFYVPNYTSANYKSVSTDAVQENNATAVNMYYDAGLWSNTAAITSITLTASAGVFSQYSTFNLYGVSALGVTPTKAPKATGGSIIQTDGTYWYHAFLSSGTFTPATALSCDVLVVAGGGGGGSGVYSAAGGGGAGGVFYATSQSVGSSAQTVTVGGGGPGGVYPSAVNGTNGSNSSFASLTVGVGGGGSGTGATNGSNGGSGGGAGAGTSAVGGTSTQTGTGGTGYGFAGGAVTATTAAAGGGGAGAVGQSTGANTGGTGGAGLNTWSSWLSTTGLGVSGYIAGGAGGAGGTTLGAGQHGGGNGAKYDVTAPTAGTANTGGGGGGGSGTSAGFGTGAAGGSGVVIIRYLA